MNFNDIAIPAVTVFGMLTSVAVGAWWLSKAILTLRIDIMQRLHDIELRLEREFASKKDLERHVAPCNNATANR